MVKIKDVFDTDCNPFNSTHSMPCYVFTNENVAGYVKKFNLQGKDVLTVAASGDHVFECLLAGAKSVETFDINANQRLVMELKSHMIKNLPYEHFMDFFFESKNLFNSKIIQPIFDTFSPKLQNYVPSFYKQRMNSPINSMFIDYDYIDIKNISYLADKEKYNQLARIIPNKIPFFNTEIHQIPYLSKKCYDIILMSNIYDYLYKTEVIDPYNKLVRCYNLLLRPLSEFNLKQNGYIVFHYLWDTEQALATLYWDCFRYNFNRKKSLYGQSVNRLEIRPANGHWYKNCILYMQKSTVKNTK